MSRMKRKDPPIEKETKTKGFVAPKKRKVKIEPKSEKEVKVEEDKKIEWQPSQEFNVHIAQWEAKRPEVQAFLKENEHKVPAELKQYIMDICFSPVCSFTLRFQACRFMLESYDKMMKQKTLFERQGKTCDVHFNLVTLSGTAGLAPLVLLLVKRNNPQRVKEILDERLASIKNMFSNGTVHLILSVVVGKDAAGVGTVLIPFQDNLTSTDLILLKEYQERLHDVLESVREKQLLIEYNYVGRGEIKDGAIYFFEPLLS